MTPRRKRRTRSGLCPHCYKPIIFKAPRHLTDEIAMSYTRGPRRYVFIGYCPHCNKPVHAINPRRREYLEWLKMKAWMDPVNFSGALKEEIRKRKISALRNRT